MTENIYDGSSIDILEGLEAVRVRPGMYIGSTNSRGLHHCLWEILDNSVDEALAGYCNQITLTINKDKSISIEDNGRGIPIDIHPKAKIPTVRVIYTIIHAGGKFKKGIYKNSGGLHGVGASVVNALSEWLEVEIYKDGNVYKDLYKNGGTPVTLLDKNGQLPSIGKSNKTGTKVSFLPDKTIFENTDWKEDIICQKLKEVAYLNKSITINYINELNDKRETFYKENGLIGFLEDLTCENNNLTPVIKIEGSSNEIEAEIVLRLSDDTGERILSYCNNIPTTEGGTHVTGFKSGLTRLINNYAKDLGFKYSFDGKDIRNGVTAIISVKHFNPQYEGQTKTKLGNTDAKGAIEEILNINGQIYFDRNYDTLKKIIDSAITIMKLRQKEDSKKNSILKESFVTASKVADCISKKPEEREIYIVEGDSAGGTAKRGRNRNIQAVLPTKGKIINVEKQNISKVLASEEIRKMIYAFGCGYGDNIDLNKLKYHKIIILSDADVDGSHIRTLFLTFCYRYLKELILNGHIYIAVPPLYKISYELTIGKTKKKIEEYVYTDKQLSALRKNDIKIIKLQRYKGLGEMNADQLKETVFDVFTRKLFQVTIDDALRAETMTQLLMGSKVGPRRDLIKEESKNSHIISV